MHRNKSVDVHQFAMIPRADIPRSSFRIETSHKTAFDGGYLIPIFLTEILPGDTFNLRMTAFVRLATPIFPFMDNLYLESFFFFVPNRLVWDNWVKFMGEQDNPADSISFIVPEMVLAGPGPYAIGSVYDYFGLGTIGQVSGATGWRHMSLPLRAYNLIWNQWFRDENLQNSVVVRKTDAGDVVGDFNLLRRGKRHDYFTSCLPWPQKGAVAVSLPLGTTAPVIRAGTGADANINVERSTVPGTTRELVTNAGNATISISGGVNDVSTLRWTTDTNLLTDLSAATAATINQIRQSFQIQRLLERDARGGTRYAEIVRSHFGVVSPDARLQRPEYLGGGSTPINVHPVAQTANTPAVGTPQGNLAGFATGLARGHGFTQSFTEHGFVIGLLNVRADLNYQQGLRKLWSRSTRYDFYFPVFAHLGEQAVLNKEIYLDSVAADNAVFGYQERWAEYRYQPAMITGLMRSTAAGTINAWHLAQRFTVLPTLNATFIQDTPPIDRVVAVGAGANGQQFLCDSFFSITAARPMPLYSVPGMVDHF